MDIRWYFTFFLVSGFCSLVYEVVWLRLSVAEFGVTTALVSIVLSMFMAGLGLGSWWAGSLSRRLRGSAASTDLRLYALTELLIGISALLVPFELRWGHVLLLRMRDAAAWQSSVYYLISGAWVALTLVPWSTCMGATFPFLMAVIRKGSHTESGTSFSYLYVANVLGAILGTTISAVLLIELFGFRHTLQITGSLNGAIAIAALVISLTPALSRSPIGLVAERREQRKLYGLPSVTVLWMLFTTGLVSMAMEVVWIRQFTPYLGNVVYAFAMILAVYLAATFWGSKDYRSWASSGQRRENPLAWAVLGILSLIPLIAADPLLPPLPGAAGFVLGVLRVELGIAPFCASVGFLTPMLVDHWSAGDPQRAGGAYAVNVLGCILGPLVAAFLLLPRLSERWSLFALSLPLLALGALVALRGQPDVGPERRLGLKTSLGYAIAVLSALLLVSVARDYEGRFPERIVRRDYSATVLAIRSGLNKQLLVNGIVMAGPAQCTKNMAHLPLAFMSRPPVNGLVICFGAGTTFRSMLSWGIQSTVVDLVPSVPAMFGFFYQDAPQVFRSPLAQVVVDDGRRFLDGSPESYDVITEDPPPPPGAPTSSLLYSREFYRIVKRHLRAGGIVQIWLPLTPPNAGTRASVAKALKESFPYVRAFEDDGCKGLQFLASMEPLSITSGSVLAARLPPAAVADFLERGQASSAEELFNHILSRERSLDKIIDADTRVPALEDDQPINEYYLLREWFHLYR